MLLELKTNHWLSTTDETYFGRPFKMIALIVYLCIIVLLCVSIVEVEALT